MQADASDAGSLRAAMAGVDVAYYLIHALGTAGVRATPTASGGRDLRDAAAQDGRGAAASSTSAGWRPTTGEELSPHLRSREEVGEILLASGVPTAVLRAAVIIGSGSASFEMLRYLTERLPAMITPRWVDTRIQPIAIRDVLRYLVGGRQLPADVTAAFDIGGPDVLTYRDMMQRYARVAGLPPAADRARCPVLTPDAVRATGSAW